MAIIQCCQFQCLRYRRESVWDDDDDDDGDGDDGDGDGDDGDGDMVSARQR